MPARISHKPPVSAAPGLDVSAMDAGKGYGLTEQVTVLDAGPAFVRIKVRDKRHCSQCSLKNGCGHKLFSEANSRLGNNQTFLLPVAPALLEQVRTGDILELTFDADSLISLSFLQYVFPVIFMLLGTAVAGRLTAEIGTGEGWVITAALGALGAGLVAVRLVSSNLSLLANLSVHTAESAKNQELDN